MKRVLVLLSISLMLFSCATVTPPKGAADGSAALEVMEIWSEAVRTEDLDLFVSTYWEDAVREILPFGGDSAVIRGQAAIAENQMGYFERFDLSGFRLPEDREIRMEDGRVPILRYMYEGGRVEEFRFESRDGQWKIINQIIIMAAPPMVVAPIHELYDANGNGRLEPGELERLLPDFRAAVSEPHEVGTPLDEFFDLNGNGVLEPAEIESIRNYFFVEQLRRIYRYDRDFGDLLDADGDGHIALWEVETVPIMFFRDPRWREPRGVEHPLDIRIDRNEDGELDEEEIRGFMERLFLRIVLLPMDMPYDARRFGTFEEIRDWADLDGDGEIDGREFRDIVFVVGTLFHGAERGAVNPVYGYFDRNKDGMLDHIEIDRARGFFFRTALSQEIETDGMDLVQALDFDRSGGVDDREIELLAEFLFLRPESESVRVETPVDRLADKNGDGNVSGEERERFENLVFARIAAAWSRSPRKNMDAWDVRTVLDELADVNGDGIVDMMENELLVIGLAGPHRAESPFDERLDVNGNGMVDDFEIVRARRAGLPGGSIEAAGEAKGPYPVKTVIDERLDLNRDGSVSEEEIGIVLDFFARGDRIEGRLPEQLLALVDFDGDGRVSREELVLGRERFLLPHPADPDSPLDAGLDANGDGFIDPEEIGIAAGVSVIGPLASMRERLEVAGWKGRDAGGEAGNAADTQTPAAPVSAAETTRRYESEFTRRLGQIQDKELAVVGLAAAAANVDVDTGKGLVIFIENAFVNVGKVKVVDRKNIEKLIEEQKFQLSGLTDESTAVEIGKLSGADIVVIGSISYVGKKFYLNIKLILVETGEIIGSSIAEAVDETEFLDMSNEAVYKLF